MEEASEDEAKAQDGHVYQLKVGSVDYIRKKEKKLDGYAVYILQYFKTSCHLTGLNMFEPLNHRAPIGLAKRRHTL